MLRVDHEAPDLAALRNEGFVADMHFHTSHSHDCRTPVREIIARARRLGIHVAFTDHNSIGGVLEARRFKGAPVIPGIELCSREGKEVIAYFYRAGDLERFFMRRIAPGLKLKNAMRSSRTPYRMRDLLLWLDGERCLVHMPHPFGPQPRKAYTFFRRRRHRPLLHAFDSVEVFNAQLRRRANLSALGWAVQLAKGMAAGSDGHTLAALGRGVTVSRARSLKGHLDNVRRGHVRIVGVEVKSHQRALGYAAGTVRVKLQKGFAGGLRKAAQLPRKALRL